jgi:hypothetical protein
VPSSQPKGAIKFPWKTTAGVLGGLGGLYGTYKLFEGGEGEKAEPEVESTADEYLNLYFAEPEKSRSKK